MKIGTKFLAVFIGAGLCICTVAIVFIELLNEISKPIEKDIPSSINRVSKTLEIDGVAQLVRYYDEVVTQSVRNYAFTGKKEWMQRYYRYEFELIEAIRQGVEKGEPDHREYFTRIGDANSKLAAMERTAIEYVNKGERNKAVDLLESDGYNRQKQQYDSALREYFSTRGLHYDRVFEFSTYTIMETAKLTEGIIHNSVRMTIILLSVVSGILLLLGWYLTKSIVNPIKMLTHHVVVISHGNLEQRVAIVSNDEIGELARNFNKMTMALKQSQEDLRRHAVELEKSNNELANEIRERIQAEGKLKDTHLQLMQSEKLASIGQLAAGVAHEINNPVGFVMSNSDTISKYLERLREIMDLYAAGASSARVAERRKELKIDYILEDSTSLLKENREGLERIGSIVKSLRDFSRIDSNPEMSITDINGCLKNSLAMARSEIKYHAEVKTDFGVIAPILCNAGEINQVFLNILVNAAQAIKEQKRDDMGTITIRTWMERDLVLCEIGDDGPGIPENIRNRVFEPFFTTKEIGKGTGLGLSISYDIIVNRHNGRISIESEVGKGTRFLIELLKHPAVREILGSISATKNSR